MTGEKRNLLNDTHKEFFDVMLFNFAPEKLKDFVVNDVMGYGTTIDERVFDLAGLQKLVALQKEQAEGIDLHFDISPIHRSITADENVAIYVDEIVISMQLTEGKNEFGVRVSTILEYQNGKWKVIHWHGSKPVDIEEDTWHKDELKKRNEELQKLVEQKTTELLVKNRELELETALERVRAEAMSMQKSDDLLNVCQIISHQLELLNISNIRNIQVAIIDESKKNYLNYQYFKAYSKKVFEITEYENNPESQAMVNEMQKSANSFYAGNIKDKALQDFRDWRKKLNQFPDPLLDESPVAYYYFYSIGNGGLGLTTYKAINEQEQIVFKRFHKVFELAYRRFHDIEKAVAQARQARIETALERVRAIAMAMQKPTDLSNIGKTVFSELKALGFDGIRNTEIVINNDEKASVTSYHFSDYGQEETIEIGYKENPIVKKWAEDLKKAEDAFVPVSIPGEELKSWDAYRLELGYKSDPEMASAKGVHYYSYSTGLGALSISTWEALPEDQIKILERFRNVFRLSYQRFKDIEQAEAQAREAQIELALERVRARTMAMQKSDELAKVSSLLFHQMRSLGIDTYSSGFNIWDTGNHDLISWMCNADGSLNPPFRMPIKGYDWHTFQYQSWKKGEEFIVKDFSGEEMQSHFKYLRTFPLLDKAFNKSMAAGHPMPERQVHHVANFSHGYLLFITLQACPEAHDIFKRFAKVFDQTYTRFLDLQKAEAQAREAQIEAALERVRSRAMAMRKSDELLEVIQIIFQEMDKLGFDVMECSIVIHDNNPKDLIYWTSSFADSGLPSSYKLQYIDHPVMSDLFRDLENGVKYRSGELSNELLQTWWDKVFTESSFKNSPKDYIESWKKIKQLYYSQAVMSHGFLEFLGSTPLPVDKVETLKRLTKVVDLTYTRFDDVVKAEAQAREAQIEAALEKIRSRTMAMQKGEDIKEVVVLLYKELIALGVTNFVTCGYVEINEEINRQFTWVTGPGGDSLGLFYLPLTGDATFDERYAAWKQQQIIFHQKVAGEVRSKHLEYAITTFNSKEAEEMVLGQFPDPCVFYCFNFSHGYLHLVTGSKLKNEEELLLARFTKVFEQTYARFLDLQKAEAQAREAQIETALERVRSKSMAMRKSEELADLSLELVKQVQNLGVESWFCAFNIYDDDQKGSLEWGSNGQGTFPKYRTPREGVFLRYYEAGKSGETLLINEIGENECPAHYDYLCSLPGVGEQLLKMKDAGIPFPTSQIDHVAYFKYGYILFITYEPAPKAHDIFKRFAMVFEQTYTRFLDLQKAEAQAREAQIEAALERVRSRTMGMQRSDDLQKTALLMFGQIEALGVPIFGCGFNIWDDDKKAATAWMAGKDRLQPPFQTSSSEDIFLRIHEFSEKGEALFVEEQSGEALRTHYKYLTSIPVFKEIADKMASFGQSFPTFQIMHCAFFSQGYLMFISYEPVSFAYDIFKRFAMVFEQTYTRFLDLQKAEAQAREAQIEAALEKVRSRSLAMHTTNELGEVVTVIVEKLKDLGVVLDANGVVLCTYFQESKDVLHWIASPDFSFAGSYLLPYFDHPIFNDTWQSKESGEAYFSKAYSVDEKNSFFEYAFEHSDYKNFPEDFKQWVFQNDQHILSFAWQKNSAILIPSHTGVVPSEDDVVILKRFARVFEQAYVRFMDLQKAEAQARETEIQLALEKVRLVALGLNKSEEMLKVAQALYEQLLKLGFSNIRNAIIDINNGDDDTFTDYDYSNEMSGTITQMSYHDDPTLEGQFKKMSTTTDDFFELVLEGKELEDLIAMRIKNGENEDLRLLNTDMLTYNLYSFGNGAIGISNFGLLNKEEKSILNRFSNVFTFAYKRYNDLASAEAQAREVQIELSLERIRAKVTSMSESSDLLDIVVSMRTEFVSLGHEAHYFWYMRWLPEIYEKAMTSGDGTKIGMIMTLPRHIHGDIQHVADWEKSNEPTVVLAMDVETAVDYVQKMITLGDFVQVDPSAPTLDDIRHINGLTFVMARTQYGEIGFSLPGKVPNPPQASLDTLVRFAGVFDLAYRRFEDLKNAEQRNRETQIELALERSRNQSMRMQHSDELNKTSQVFHEQLELLGIDSEFSYLWLPDEANKEHLFWATWNEDNKGSTVFKNKAVTYPLDKSEPSIAECYVAWESDELVHVNPVAPNEVEEYFATWEELLHGVDKFKPELFPDGIYYVDAYMKYGCFGIMIKRKITEDEKNILSRFSIEFERAYTRFLDLQKAEAQTREAQIEVGLERVRARALAMQDPVELKEVAQVLRHEMGLLGVEELETSSIYIHDKNTHDAECWYAIKDVRDEGKTLVNDYFSLNLNDTWVGKEMLRFYTSKKEKVSIVMTGKPRIEWIRYCEERSPQLRGYYGDNIPDRTYHLYKFTHGAIGAATPGGFSDENWGLLKRAAAVFSLAYSRFKDLTQARYDLQLLKEEKKRAEDALTELKSTQTQLIHAEKMASLGELTAGIAHEIQNPLNFVNNFSEVNAELIAELKEEIEKGDKEEAMAIADDIAGNEAKISHHGKRADGIVKGMLQHSRTSADKKEPTDMNVLADEYLRLSYHGLRAKNKSFYADFKTGFDPDLPKINVIPQDIGRVLLNLINNAFYTVREKALEANPGFKALVSVSTSKLKGYVEIKVKDNGKGIPEDVKDKIFQPFFTTKPTGEGTGLGLSLSYEIVTKGHRGKLRVETKENEGSEFLIHLPITLNE